MSLLPSEASFAEEVSDYFLAFRGAGVMLSPLDAELVLAWEERGVPYEVVCRGIRRAAESCARDARPGEPALRSLRGCKRSVEDEFRRYQGRSAGRRVGRPVENAVQKVAHDRLAKARAALKHALAGADGPRRAAIERTLPLAGGAASDPAEAARRVARLDDALALCYLRALPAPERRALLRQVREQVGPALSRMSPRARRLALRGHRVMRARAHGELPALK